jgi:hypothetical protein
LRLGFALQDHYDLPGRDQEAARAASAGGRSVLDFREDAGDDLVEVVVDGRVSKAEFDAIATRLEAAIARHGKLRVLEVVRSFGGIDPSAFWADLKFGLRHLNHFSRCAVVSDRRWIEVFAKGVDKLIACEIRHFPPEQIDAARAWLRADAA